MTDLEKLIADLLLQIDPQESGVEAKAKMMAGPLGDFFTKVFTEWAKNPLGVGR